MKGMEMPRGAAGPLVIALFLLSGNLADVNAQPMGNPGRGELLYSTHCIACHNARVHWREGKLATDWKSLQSQVRRWQKVQALGWSNEDIAAVARYLNTFYYLYPAPD